MERKIGEIPVLQRTKDGMFNATAFVNAWNAVAPSLGFSKKDIKEFMTNKSTKDFVEALKNDPEFLHRGNSPYVICISERNIAKRIIL